MLANLKGDGSLEKVAGQGGFALSPEDEETVKLAEDCYAAGRIMGHGVIAGILEKLADSPVPATGVTEPSTGDESVDKSQFKNIADKVMRFKGKESPGSTPSVQGSNPGVVAETTAPPQVARPNPEEKTGG
jgi:hypothetical protein